MAEEWGFEDKFGAFAIALDKWDKVGEHGVIQELGSKGFTETQMHRMQQIFRLEGNLEEKLKQLESWFKTSETGKKGLAELGELVRYLSAVTLKKGKIELDLKLARGLDYYTSTIFEVVLDNVKIGSIASGGRYDELTNSFGVPDMPGVGLSFGAERIFDVMKDLNLLPKQSGSLSKVLLVNFGGEEELHSFKVVSDLRKENIPSEMYPSQAKMGKQFQYAERKGITYALVIGSDEIKQNTFTLKNLGTGVQNSLNWAELLEVLRS
jgi:histidyl-tRNA synthetase